MCATKLCKSPIRCHEARQHGGDQSQRIADRLSALACKEFGVDDQVPMYTCRQFKCDLDGLSVLN